MGQNLHVTVINGFFRDWTSLTESQRLDFIRILRTNGVLNKVTPPKLENSIQCPVNGFLLAKPCNLSACNYHANAPQYKNCLAQCLSQSKTGRLSAMEVAGLLNSSVSEINSVSNSASRKIRLAMVLDVIERKFTSRFKYIEGHCVHCEMNILPEFEMGHDPSLVIEEKFGWCSPECKQKKPKWQFQLEYKFGVHFLEVVKSALSVTHLKIESEKKKDRQSLNRAELTRMETVDEILGLDPGMTNKIRNKFILNTGV